MEKQSIQSRLYRVLIRLAGIKKKVRKQFRSGDFTRAHQAAAIPASMQKRLDGIRRTSTTRRTVWELRKKGGNPKHYLFFMHGGGFVFNITKYDWAFLNKLIQRTDVGVVVPDYPLTPTHNYRDVFDMIVPEYENLVRSVGSENVTLIGFSVGAGITLSLAQYARQQQIPQPSRIILLSPFLDATIQHPDIPVIDRYDPYIDVEGVKMAIAAYASGTTTDNYMVSPIRGCLEGLAPIHLFMGTHEVLLPDARRLVAMARERSAPVSYYEYPWMYHAWIFLEMPEARDVMEKVAKIIAADGK